MTNPSQMTSQKHGQQYTFNKLSSDLIALLKICIHTCILKRFLMNGCSAQGAGTEQTVGIQE